jgi:hypothetical protein
MIFDLIPAELLAFESTNAFSSGKYEVLIVGWAVVSCCGRGDSVCPAVDNDEKCVCENSKDKILRYRIVVHLTGEYMLIV